MENSSESKLAAAKRFGIIILLGAIGSGLWAGVGEPLFNVIGNEAVRTVNWFSGTYLESMYAEVGKGLHESNASFLHSSVSGLFVGFWFILPLSVYSMLSQYKKRIVEFRAKLKAIDNGDPVASSPEDKKSDQMLTDVARIARKLTVLFWVLVVVTPLAVTFQIATLYRNSYTLEAIVYVERSIDILSPQIDSDSILRLRANYRAISNRKQFVALYQELSNYARAKNVELPAFSPL